MWNSNLMALHLPDGTPPSGHLKYRIQRNFQKKCIHHKKAFTTKLFRPKNSTSPKSAGQNLCSFSCSLSIDSKSWVITSCKDWSRSMRPLWFSLSTSAIETSSAHSRCFFNLLYSPTTAPTRLVLWFTPAANDSVMPLPCC